ncbi:MAG: mevalonate kinase [Aigarchaeota archaeon]|nr:mevalonate kinase [Aigarchaeota archaeon]
MGEGSGYGKVILFGEHFVVYGLPAIASAIGSKTTATVTCVRESGWHLEDERPEMPGYKREKADQQRVSINNILRFAGLPLDRQGIKIRFGGDLVCASGIGASAAGCAALARALSDEFNLGWDDEKVNEAAYEGEKGYHGTPSGIDNTAATFGGLIWFEKDMEGGPNIVRRIGLKEPADLVIANTGITADTVEVVADVRRRREEDSRQFEEILARYRDLVSEAEAALTTLDLNRVGLLMNANHDLLVEIGVSCNELEELVALAREEGALGAKLTGTGRGGNIIALTPGKRLQEGVVNAFKMSGVTVWPTRIGV